MIKTKKIPSQVLLVHADVFKQRKNKNITIRNTFNIEKLEAVNILLDIWLQLWIIIINVI